MAPVSGRERQTEQGDVCVRYFCIMKNLGNMYHFDCLNVNFISGISSKQYIMITLPCLGWFD
jgi:hypothetical protein